jgi:tetratricopeptide (TPR) repeat protein
MSTGIEMEYHYHGQTPSPRQSPYEERLGSPMPLDGASTFTETDLALLCLDYMRDLRRSFPADVLEHQEGIKSEYLTLACWALNRALAGAPTLTNEGSGQAENDCFFQPRKASKAISFGDGPKLGNMLLPGSMEEMESEILQFDNPEQGDKKEDDEDIDNLWYEYDDQHSSNVHRFYPLGGLASGPSWPGPLTLGELATAACLTLKSKTRLQAEQELIQSELFDQFVQAVQEKGFFKMDASVTTDEAREIHYEERFRKVVAKFRVKMATREEMTGEGHPADLGALEGLEDYQRKRELRIQDAHDLHQEWMNSQPSPRKQDRAETSSNVGTEVSTASYVKRTAFAQRILSMAARDMKGGGDMGKDTSLTLDNNPADLVEAERLKNQGNTRMQKKEYQAAADCYTSALKLSPAGPQSHVYFSNRAAALVSLRKFHEAILDSERSLSLRPDYGKAHARLGLAHFLLGNYRQAMEAYTVALRYEPDNKASKSYLEKAAKRLAESGAKGSTPDMAVSFSAVSEFGKIPASKRETFEKQRSEKEAEHFKTRGNSLMTNRDYEEALDNYNQAIACSPNGTQSHVYYSNRAAALCYLERYNEAEADSLKSLRLEPTYGKAHARLGLSRFFLHKYAGAVEAYTHALKHDPHNAASRSYLAKARARLSDTDIKAAQAEKTRRLLTDENIRTMTAKAILDPTKDLMNDPEMIALSKKAMAAMRN